jgi:hypothetical protein
MLFSLIQIYVGTGSLGPFRIITEIPLNEASRVRDVRQRGTHDGGMGFLYVDHVAHYLEDWMQSYNQRVSGDGKSRSKQSTSWEILPWASVC